MTSIVHLIENSKLRTKNVSGKLSELNFFATPEFNQDFELLSTHRVVSSDVYGQGEEYARDARDLFPPIDIWTSLNNPVVDHFKTTRFVDMHGDITTKLEDTAASAISLKRAELMLLADLLEVVYRDLHDPIEALYGLDLSCVPPEDAPCINSMWGFVTRELASLVCKIVSTLKFPANPALETLLSGTHPNPGGSENDSVDSLGLVDANIPEEILNCSLLVIKDIVDHFCGLTQASKNWKRLQQIGVGRSLERAYLNFALGSEDGRVGTFTDVDHPSHFGHWDKLAEDSKGAPFFPPQPAFGRPSPFGSRVYEGWLSLTERQPILAARSPHGDSYLYPGYSTREGKRLLRWMLFRMHTRKFVYYCGKINTFFVQLRQVLDLTSQEAFDRLPHSSQAGRVISELLAAGHSPGRVESLLNYFFVDQDTLFPEHPIRGAPEDSYRLSFQDVEFQEVQTPDGPRFEPRRFFTCKSRVFWSSLRSQFSRRLSPEAFSAIDQDKNLKTLDTGYWLTPILGLGKRTTLDLGDKFRGSYLYLESVIPGELEPYHHNALDLFGSQALLGGPYGWEISAFSLLNQSKLDTLYQFTTIALRGVVPANHDTITVLGINDPEEPTGNDFQVVRCYLKPPVVYTPLEEYPPRTGKLVFDDTAQLRTLLFLIKRALASDSTFRFDDFVAEQYHDFETLVCEDLSSADYWGDSPTSVVGLFYPSLWHFFNKAMPPMELDSSDLLLRSGDVERNPGPTVLVARIGREVLPLFRAWLFEIWCILLIIFLLFDVSLFASEAATKRAIAALPYFNPARSMAGCYMAKQVKRREELGLGPISLPEVLTDHKVITCLNLIDNPSTQIKIWEGEEEPQGYWFWDFTFEDGTCCYTGATLGCVSGLYDPNQEEGSGELPLSSLMDSCMTQVASQFPSGPDGLPTRQGLLEHYHLPKQTSPVKVDTFSYLFAEALEAPLHDLDSIEEPPLDSEEFEGTFKFHPGSPENFTPPPVKSFRLFLWDNLSSAWAVSLGIYAILTLDSPLHNELSLCTFLAIYVSAAMICLCICLDAPAQRARLIAHDKLLRLLGKRKWKKPIRPKFLAETVEDAPFSYTNGKIILAREVNAICLCERHLRIATVIENTMINTTANYPKHKRADKLLVQPFVALNVPRPKEKPLCWFCCVELPVKSVELSNFSVSPNEAPLALFNTLFLQHFGLPHDATLCCGEKVGWFAKVVKRFRGHSPECPYSCSLSNFFEFYSNTLEEGPFFKSFLVLLNSKDSPEEPGPTVESGRAYGATFSNHTVKCKRKEAAIRYYSPNRSVLVTNYNDYDELDRHNEDCVENFDDRETVSYMRRVLTVESQERPTGHVKGSSTKGFDPFKEFGGIASTQAIRTLEDKVNREKQTAGDANAREVLILELKKMRVGFFNPYVFGILARNVYRAYREEDPISAKDLTEPFLKSRGIHPDGPSYAAFDGLSKLPPTSNCTEIEFDSILMQRSIPYVVKELNKYLQRMLINMRASRDASDFDFKESFRFMHGTKNRQKIVEGYLEAFVHHAFPLTKASDIGAQKNEGIVRNDVEYKENRWGLKGVSDEKAIAYAATSFRINIQDMFPACYKVAISNHITVGNLLPRTKKTPANLKPDITAQVFGNFDKDNDWADDPDGEYTDEQRAEDRRIFQALRDKLSSRKDVLNDIKQIREEQANQKIQEADEAISKPKKYKADKYGASSSTENAIVEAFRPTREAVRPDGYGSRAAFLNGDDQDQLEKLSGADYKTAFGKRVAFDFDQAAHNRLEALRSVTGQQRTPVRFNRCCPQCLNPVGKNAPEQPAFVESSLSKKVKANLQHLVAENFAKDFSALKERVSLPIPDEILASAHVKELARVEGVVSDESKVAFYKKCKSTFKSSNRLTPAEMDYVSPIFDKIIDDLDKKTSHVDLNRKAARDLLNSKGKAYAAFNGCEFTKEVCDLLLAGLNLSSPELDSPALETMVVSAIVKHNWVPKDFPGEKKKKAPKTKRLEPSGFNPPAANTPQPSASPLEGPVKFSLVTKGTPPPPKAEKKRATSTPAKPREKPGPDARVESSLPEPNAHGSIETTHPTVAFFAEGHPDHCRTGVYLKGFWRFGSHMVSDNYGWPVGLKGTLHTCHKPNGFPVEVLDSFGDITDPEAAWVKFRTPEDYVKLPDVATIVPSQDPNIKCKMHLWVLRDSKVNKGTKTWILKPAEVVIKRDKAYHDADTDHGDCATPYYSQHNGGSRIFAFHHYGGLYCNGKSRNAGDLVQPDDNLKMVDKRGPLLMTHHPDGLLKGSGAHVQASLDTLPCIGKYDSTYIPKNETAKVPKLRFEASTLLFPLQYVHLKPSDEHAAMEMHKFAGNVEFGFTQAQLHSAFCYVGIMDQDFSIATDVDVNGPNALKRCRFVMDFLIPQSSCGLGPIPSLSPEEPLSCFEMYKTQGELFESFGNKVCPEGALEEKLSAGKDHFAALLLAQLKDILDGKFPLTLWGVFPKRDNYKVSALEQTKFRSIQSPNTLFKALWLYYFMESDEEWVHDKVSPYHVSYTGNAPMQDRYYQPMMMANAVASTDVTGWDRRMPREALHGFFMVYLNIICPRIPHNVLLYFLDCTCNSLMVNKGNIFMKSHGNPSGFPNTLRLNCVVHRAVNLILARLALFPHAGDLDYEEIEAQHLVSLYCGDDVINFSLSEECMNIMPHGNLRGSLIDAWDANTPWVVKLEGFALLKLGIPYQGDYPPFVSRKPLCYRGTWFLAYTKPEKAVTKLLLDKPREELAEIILGISVSLALQLIMHLEADAFCPICEFIVQRWDEDHNGNVEPGEGRALYPFLLNSVKF